ncbi:MAG: DsbA family oxidoreductase [Inquilinus sp.]|uniref:DsbA family oxidoreductase n=1 Tax=Inquilinus sp. TaxID=1932117 RepID=UPI003F2BE09F
MTDRTNDLPPIEPLIRGDGPDAARRVLHWYDLLCPFCYVGQQRNTIFAANGFEVIELPFQAHPDIPPGGRQAGERSDALVARIEAEAKAAGLPLSWPARLPNTRAALAAAEWVRRHAPSAFPPFQKALFAAHFALGQDLGDREVIDRLAAAAGIDIAAMHAALADRSAYALVDQSEALGRHLGVQGTPAWLVAGHLIPGLYPPEQLEALLRRLAA